LRIVWTDNAVANLEAIVTYVTAFDPTAAGGFAARLIAVADSLASFPLRGRDVGDGRREMTTGWPVYPAVPGGRGRGDYPARASRRAG